MEARRVRGEAPGSDEGGDWRKRQFGPREPREGTDSFQVWKAEHNSASSKLDGDKEVSGVPKKTLRTEEVSRHILVFRYFKIC